MRLNDHVIWIQPNKVNMKEMDYGLKEIMKHDQWKCGLKEMRWNMNNEVQTDGNEMKHEQWSVSKGNKMKHEQ